MYPCCSGIIFLKPASTRSCAAKNPIATVISANTASRAMRLPNTSDSAKRWKALGGFGFAEGAAMFPLDSTVWRCFGVCLLRLEHADAVFAGDQQRARVAARQDA